MNDLQTMMETLDLQECSLRIDGLPLSSNITDLENLTGSLENLLETANNLFDKIG